MIAALPGIGFALTFGWFFVDKNREARTVLASPRGVFTVAVVIGGYLVVALLVRQLARREWIPPLVLTAVVLALAAWIVRPYYFDKTAERILVSGPVVTVTTTTPPQSTTTGPAAPTGTTAPVLTSTVPVATRISTGPLKGIGHQASGTASLIRKPDGSLIVRLENFDIEGVPDPRVHLVPSKDATRPGGVDLGRLPGNRGRILDIAVPPSGNGAGTGWTVLVWCRAFSVPVANSTQQAPGS